MSAKTASDATDQVAIEIAYAEPELQVLLKLNVPEGTSVYDAVAQSGLAQKYPQIDLSVQALGIFGKTVRKPGEQSVKAGDRIEIYRAVKKAPKAVDSNTEKKEK